MVAVNYLWNPINDNICNRSRQPTRLVISVGVSEMAFVPSARSKADPGDSWLYTGKVRFDSHAMPGEYQWVVFIHEGKVLDILDPFDGARSASGAPTVPHLLVPSEGWKGSGFPYMADLRWYMSDGLAPMSYDIEVDVDSRVAWTPNSRVTTNMPYAAIELKGKNRARWRVRARNELGTSEWSEYR
jgi:hypothetical protein